MVIRRRLAIMTIIAAGLLLMFGASAEAQTTGSVRGQAVDPEGNRVPGVMVTLTGDPLPGSSPSTVTDAQGEFRFSGLPVGKYSLTASLSGFKNQTAEDVRVTIGGTGEVTIFMHPEAFAGEIAVTSDAPLVDVNTSTVTTNFDDEFIDAMPTRNNFYDIMSVAPAMSQPHEGSSAFSGYGGNVTSQQWNIDGLNMAAPEGGWLSWNLNPMVIAETQLLGVGAGAQYGNTMGNVYNVVTKSGTNSFHGAIDTYYQSDALTDTNIDVDVDDLPDYRLWTPGGHYIRDKYIDARATIGGPIVRDRLWFFAGIQYQDSAATTPNEVPDVPGTGNELKRYDIKLSSQLGQAHRLDLRAHAQNSHGEPPPDMFQELSAVQINDWETEMVTLDYSAMLSQNSLLAARVGTWNRNAKFDSKTGSDEERHLDDIYDGPALVLGGPWWFSKRDEEYTQAEISFTQFADDFAGDHEFKFGVQYTEGTGFRTVGKSSFTWRQPGGFGYPYWSFRWGIFPPFIYGAETESTSAFAQDSWQVSNRLTFDIGVRYDSQQGWIPSYPEFDNQGNPTGEMLPSADMIDWKNWAPRLGFAWQPTANGKTVIRGFVGLFWDSPVSSAWYAPPPGRGDAQLWWVNPAWGQVYSRPVAPADELLAEGTESPHTWQYALSWDQQIGNNFAFGIQLNKKTSDDTIGWYLEDDGVYEPFSWTDPYTGDVIELWEVIVAPTARKGNSPGPGSMAPDVNYFIDYESAILTFRKRYSNNWDLMASYTWSRTEGINVRPHENGSLGQGLPGFTADTGSDPNDWYNAEHTLQGDRTHMFRIQSNVDVGWGLRLSGILNIQSGRPYLRLAQVVDPNGSALTITVDNSDDLRMPSSAVFDLGVQKVFNTGRGTDLTLGIQILNLFNEDAVEYWSTWNINQLPDGTLQDFTPSNWVNPRRAQIRVKFAF
jgi:outer membrane receptor protein involved in Fe transport